jgi:8-amino-7-oxononanoate synthase
MTVKTRKIDFLPSRVATFDGEEHLFFSGTSYLGIGHQPEFRAALMEGIDRYGTIFSASRNNNLQLKIYEETEDFLANWTGSEAALTVTSGLLAGQLAVNFLKNSIDLKGNKTVFIYAPSAHPAVWEAPPQYLFDNQLDFENNILNTIEKEKDAPIVVVSNAVDMLTCESFDFSWVTQLSDNEDITLLIDDSHGIGVTGENGAGIFKTIKNLANKNIKIIVIASLAKALGIPGGVILSEKKTINNIRNNPLFVGASPIVPAYLFAFLLAQPMYDTARQTLIKNIQLFKKNLKELNAHLIINAHSISINNSNSINNSDLINNSNLINNSDLINDLDSINNSDLINNPNSIKNTPPQYKSDSSTNSKNTPPSNFKPQTSNSISNFFKTPFDNYPVFFTPKNELFDALLAEKIFISHFAYPKPNDPPITRVVLSALHSAEDIEYLTIKINNFLKNSIT